MELVATALRRLANHRKDYVERSTKYRWEGGTPDFLPPEYFSLLSEIGSANSATGDKGSDIIPLFNILSINKALEVYRSAFWEPNLEAGYFPIMENYSSDYLSIGKDGSIYFVFHDDEPFKKYDDMSMLILAVERNYALGWYFRGDDWWLGYDEEIEDRVFDEIRGSLRPKKTSV